MKSQIKKSNWAKFAERVHKANILSVDAADFILQQSKELREDFYFKHDNEKEKMSIKKHEIIQLVWIILFSSEIIYIGNHIKSFSD